MTGASTGYFHTGHGVADLTKAQEGLGAALGLTWGPTLCPTILGWPLRISISCQGPPWLELIEAPEGSPWVPGGGETMTHLGYWSYDLSADRDRLCAAGYEVGIDGPASGYPFVYLRPPHDGPWLELSSATEDRVWRDHVEWARAAASSLETDRSGVEGVPAFD